MLQKTARFYHDCRGERIRKETYDAGGRLTKTYVYFFDVQGRRLQTLAVETSGEVTSSTNFSYNKDGLFERIEYRQGLDAVKNTTSVKCDPTGRILEKAGLDRNGQVAWTQRYVY